MIQQPDFWYGPERNAITKVKRYLHPRCSLQHHSQLPTHETKHLSQDEMWDG